MFHFNEIKTIGYRNTYENDTLTMDTIECQFQDTPFGWQVLTLSRDAVGLFSTILTSQLYVSLRENDVKKWYDKQEKIFLNNCILKKKSFLS